MLVKGTAFFGKNWCSGQARAQNKDSKFERGPARHFSWLTKMRKAGTIDATKQSYRLLSKKRGGCMTQDQSQGRRLTMAQIAKEVGVSTTTVSKVLNQQP